MRRWMARGVSLVGSTDRHLLLYCPFTLDNERIFAFPGEVRRILYTTNAIEAVNAKLRRAVRTRGHFPTDDAALKLLFLVLNRAEKKWTMPPHHWCLACAQFAIVFGERFTKVSN